MNQSPKAPIWEVTYADDYDELTGNIMKVNADFLSVLQQHESIIIEGREDEDFLFSVDNHTYKLRDIFIPSTMLLTKELVQTESQRDVTYVSLETAHYLKLETHDIEYNTIYAELIGEAVSRQLFEESQSIEQLVVASGINYSAICGRFRVTTAQLEQLLKHMPAMVLHSKDLSSLEEPTVIVWSNEVMLIIMRELLPFIMQLGAGDWFTFQQVQFLAQGLVKHQRVLQLLAKVFEMEVEGSCSSVWSLSEPMELEQAEHTRFKLKVESIVRFIIMEHALAKEEYNIKEMDSSLLTMVLTYLPVGLPAFQEEKAKKVLQDLIGEYFFTIPKQNLTARVAYDPLVANSTVKDRLDFLRGYKKKFSLNELRGVFRRMVKEAQLGDILMKHFRKCGHEYQLKLVIPK